MSRGEPDVTHELQNLAVYSLRDHPVCVVVADRLPGHFVFRFGTIRSDRDFIRKTYFDYSGPECHTELAGYERDFSHNHCHCWFVEKNGNYKFEHVGEC